jgi:large subunit ribosomal protein L24
MMADYKYHIRKNDKVMVIAGKEKGKIGSVLKVIPKREGAVIEKLNMVKRHTRPSGKTGKGGIVEKEAPINLSNLLLVCSKCAEPARVGRKVLEDGSKVRFCKKCGEFLDK